MLGIADAVLAVKLRGRRTRLLFLQNADNLFVCEAAALHSLVLSMRQSLLQNGLFQRGKVISSGSAPASWTLGPRRKALLDAYDEERFVKRFDFDLVAGAGFEPAAFRL